jgi:hypothetical protein
LRAALSYHSLATQAADAISGNLIDVSSSAVMLPVLGILTLRLPLGDFAAYSHVGCGGAWVWASREALGTGHSANNGSWAVHGALGSEIALGPGWLGVEVGYLILPSLELPGVFQQYQGEGLTASFHFRLGM